MFIRGWIRLPLISVAIGVALLVSADSAVAQQSTPEIRHAEMAMIVDGAVLNIAILYVGDDTPGEVRSTVAGQFDGDAVVVAQYNLTGLVRTATPTTMTYNPANRTGGTIPANHEQLIVNGLLEWNGISPSFGYSYGGQTTDTNTACGGDGPNGRSTIHWMPQPDGIMAFACWFGSEWDECDIVIDPEWDWVNRVDLWGVMTHEAGHCAGLGHSDQPGTMKDGRREPSQDDINGLCAIYGCVTFRVIAPQITRDAQ